MFTEWYHDGEASEVEPTMYMLWVTLFQSTLGFFTPAMANDLLESLGSLVTLPGREPITIENNETKGHVLRHIGMTFPAVTSKYLPDDVLVPAKVRHEKIKVFCYYCGLHGHKIISCPKLLKDHPHTFPSNIRYITLLLILILFYFYLRS